MVAPRWLCCRVVVVACALVLVWADDGQDAQLDLLARGGASRLVFNDATDDTVFTIARTAGGDGPQPAQLSVQSGSHTRVSVPVDPAAAVEVTGDVHSTGQVSDGAGNTVSGVAAAAARAQLGVAPVGSVLAWYPGLIPGAPAALPDNWVRCDGQIVTLPAGGNVTVPDINHSRRFLRGGEEAGVVEEDAIQGHGHEWVSRWDSANAPGNHHTDAGAGSGAGSYTKNGRIRGPITLSGYGPVRVADETRPKSLSVVWVMRLW